MNREQQNIIISDEENKYEPMDLNFSFIINDSKNHLENRFTSKLHYLVDYALAIYMGLLSVLTLLLNGIVIFTILNRKKKVDIIELFVVQLAVLGILPAIFTYPIDVWSLAGHGWPIGILGCQFTSCIVYFFGNASIMIVSVTAVFRYIRVCHSEFSKQITVNKVYPIIFCIYAYSSIWAIAPLFGWGSYGPETIGVCCSLDWVELPLSYLLSIFIGVYILPLLSIIICYGRIAYIIYVATSNTNFIRKRMDVYMFKMMLAMSVCFITAWTPYAIVSFTHYFTQESNAIPLSLHVISPYCAKTSTLLNPILYFFIVKKFRLEVIQNFNDLFHCNLTFVRTTNFDISPEIPGVNVKISADSKCLKQNYELQLMPVKSL